MTPAEFIHKWGRSELRERQGAQEHFIDLCRLLGEKTPAEADPFGTAYCFERGAGKVGGGDGWADVWKRGCFGFEYKGKHKDLGAALRQLQIYAPDLENPPYLVVCDMERIIVHTNWTNTVRRTFELGFDELREPAKLDILRQVFIGSDRLKPTLSPQELTAKVAERFGDLGKRLQERGQEPRAVAHFLNRLIFCLFAEDAGLLPKDLFTRMLRNVSYEQYNIPKKSKARFDALFAMMKEGGFFGADAIRWFNGGLFDEAEALPLERDDLDMVIKTAREHDWSHLDPAILGTMFETALKTTGRRAALGAHYTDREKILKIVEPVIVRPLAAEWETALAAIRAETSVMVAAETERKAIFEKAAAELAGGGASDRKSKAARQNEVNAILRRRDDALRRATETRDAFLARLAAFRVLDPACGSGNFLYVALHALRDIELRALLDAERLGVPQVRPKVGLDAVRGIEIEPYAAELARVTLWIGNLQWERRNGFSDPDEPILATLDTIECRDALLNADGSEAMWPEADVIVGNPPFLGGADQLHELGEEITFALRNIYFGRVPARADLVVYWLQKAAEKVLSNTVTAFGLVATKSVAKGVSRAPLDALCATEKLIFEAWTNEPWTLKGAAVRVCMVCAASNPSVLSIFSNARLNGDAVASINPDLTSGLDITRSKPLQENLGVAFQGLKLTGPFDIRGEEARALLKEPMNVNGKPNKDVVTRLFDIDDIVGRDSDRWVIDLSNATTKNEAAGYEKPFEVILKRVVPFRTSEGKSRSSEDRLSSKFWQFQRPRPRLRKAIESLDRFIITPESSEYRLFIYASRGILIQGSLFAFARHDDVFFGIVSSSIHEVWSTAQGNRLGVGNQRRYNVGVTFETFPFPEGLTPQTPANTHLVDVRAQMIADAASALNHLREAWLNPPDLVRVEPEVAPGYPDRILPKDEEAAKVLKTRTLTNLYNLRPAWLANAHAELDAAVAAAYGWPADLSDDEILARLFALNQERAAAGR